MLDFTQVRIEQSRQLKVATGFLITAEGQVLVSVLENGERKVKPSAGVANEIFAGISIAQQITPEALPKQDAGILGAAGFELSFTPITGQIGATIGGVAATIVAVAPAAGELQLDGKTLIPHADDVGTDVVVNYRFVPTATQIKTIQGDIPPGGAASLVVDEIGGITRGVVATTEYDPTVNWSGVAPNTKVKTGPNGLVTVGGNGTDIGEIEHIPTAEESFLVISFTTNP